MIDLDPIRKMQEETTMNSTLIGLDLAKNVFHAVELDGHGKPHWRKRFSRAQLRHHFANHPPAHIAMEACASAHYWARSFIAQGHTVSLFPPKHVKAYLRGQKNDYNDAQAIAEAALHGALRPVPVKTVAQQDEQALHRMRSQCVGERTRVVNQLRGLLAEYGLVIPAGSAAVRQALPVILSDADNGLTDGFRALLHRQYQRLVALDEEAQWYAEQLQRHGEQDEVCRRLQDIPGFGPVVSSAVKCWMGDGRQFGRGRDAAAALGLVPRQCSSADKERLLGITKRGDKYTRTQVINGARSVVIHAARKTDVLSRWINRLVETRGFNKAVVALANKLIRIAWVVIARGECYQSREALVQG
jgi:transposase